MAKLSVIIVGRCEQFFSQTVEDVLRNIRGDTEVLCMCDEVWPTPPIKDHPKLTVVYHNVPIGQRGATNEGARISKAKYILKADAHCAFDKGFDVKLMEPYESGELEMTATTIPRMYNLHAFDWMCDACGDRVYQGPRPAVCAKCGHDHNHQEMVWRRRRSRRTDYARFDNEMHFQYWQKYEKRGDLRQRQIDDVMCSVGACFMMPRDRFWELGGMDEGHGSWGQFGVELACKAWLSGGRQVVNKNAWFSHMFRTNNHGFSFPYHINGRDVDRARRYSQQLWLHDNWPQATRPLQWLVDKFSPIPGWNEPNEQTVSEP